MPCITPNHHLSILIHEDLVNFIIAKFHRERPHLFRLVSKGIEPSIIGIPNEQAPIKIGETGHYLDFDICIASPPLGQKYADFHPVSTHPFEFTIANDQILVQFRIQFSFQDRAFGENFEFDIQAGLLCEFKFAAESQWLFFDILDVDLLGLVPATLEEAIEYAAMKLANSALEGLRIPVNYFSGEPIGISIEETSTTQNCIIVRMSVNM